MAEHEHPLAALTDAGLEALLKRAIRITLIIGFLSALALWKASGWRDAAMMVTGTTISAASILEWQRLMRFINAKLDNKQASGGATVAVLFFMLRLIVFGGAIYVSLKWFRGSAVALLCGLGLAMLALVLESLRLLRD